MEVKIYIIVIYMPREKSASFPPADSLVPDTKWSALKFKGTNALYSGGIYNFITRIRSNYIQRAIASTYDLPDMQCNLLNPIIGEI